MSKRLFEILDDMNQSDTNNGTQLVRISNIFLEGNKVKQGAIIAMGAEEKCLHDIMNDESIPLLIMVDRKEYEARQGK